MLGSGRPLPLWATVVRKLAQLIRKCWWTLEGRPALVVPSVREALCGVPRANATA
jgi:hypothetical protein